LDSLFRFAIAGNALADTAASKSMEAAVSVKAAPRVMMARAVPGAAPSFSFAAAMPPPPSAAPFSADMVMSVRESLCAEEDEMADMGECEERDMKRRASAPPQQYQSMDKTMEYAETHYFKRQIGACDAGLIPMNEFWFVLCRWSWFQCPRCQCPRFFAGLILRVTKARRL
jgi:hypothetical protein